MSRIKSKGVAGKKYLAVSVLLTDGNVCIRQGKLAWADNALRKKAFSGAKFKYKFKRLSKRGVLCKKLYTTKTF